MDKPQVSIVKCKTYNPPELFLKVKESLELIGGIERFVKPGSQVLVKPNLLMATLPDTGITTHPEFVRAVIRILKSLGCKVIVGDGPSVFGSQIENVLKVYEQTGIQKIAQEEAVELVVFDKRYMPASPAGSPRGEAAGRLTYFPLTNWVKDCDYIVNIPKFKTHEYMILTGAVKNLFGLIPGTFKLECHKNFHQPEDFAKMLLDVYAAVKPAISIVDGITGIEGNGPATSGTKRDFGLILASPDALALDTVLAGIMDTNPKNIYTLKEAAKRGISSLNLSDIEVKGEPLSSCVIPDFRLPGTSLMQRIRNKLPQPIANILKRMVTFRPKIDTDVCRLCEACVKNCPQKIMSKKDNRIVIDYSQCISCFCCREVCPYAAIGIKKSFLAKILSK